MSADDYQEEVPGELRAIVRHHADRSYVKQTHEEYRPYEEEDDSEDDDFKNDEVY